MLVIAIFLYSNFYLFSKVRNIIAPAALISGEINHLLSEGNTYILIGEEYKALGPAASFACVFFNYQDEVRLDKVEIVTPVDVRGSIYSSQYTLL